MILDIAWWNTGLSGPKHSSKPQKRKSAAESISELLTTKDIDLLALCEVSSEDIAEIRAHIDINTYELRPLLDKVGKSAFHMCLIYKRDKVEIKQSTPVISKKNRHNFKIAQSIQMIVTGEMEILYLFLSHWPSRLRDQKDESRVLYGTRLRDQIDPVLIMNSDANIILMGDYNDEPFDPSIADALLASRDREHVINREELFYNPFWRHISSYDRDVGLSDQSDIGTYFNKSGDLTRWWTLDQIIFSSAFIRKCTWTADEKMTRIVNTGTIADLLGKKDGFDHLPIISRIERN